MDYIEKLENNTKTDAFKKCLQELTQEVNNIHTNNTDSDVKKALKRYERINYGCSCNHF